jgi:phenylacetate-coenzyme A ligase PaaK-like adenylate-forming protein
VTTATWLERAQRSFVDLVPEHLERLAWPASRLVAHQRELLRELLGHAAAESPFHRDRLAGIDPHTFELDDLVQLPVMTKAEMMERFDEVCTDRRLTRDAVDAHVRRLGEDVELFEGGYVVFASGGSSGRRGLFVRHHTELPDYLATVLRSGMADVAAVFGWPPPFRLAVTVAAAPTAVHATRASAPISGGVGDVTFVPATLQFDEIIARVEASQPMLLAGYTSLIARLGDAAAAGALGINPQAIVVTSEQLTPSLRGRIELGFGKAPANSFSSSEGLIGSAPPGDDVVTFASDTAIVEFVDAHDQPVPNGTQADHVLVTVLNNRTQPLIRYRMDDAMTPMAPDDHHGHRRALVAGRNDDPLRFGDVEIHPVVLSNALVPYVAVHEYQAHCGDGTLSLAVVASGPVDEGALARELADRLAAIGAHVRVTARRVDALQRDPLTGKAPRVILDARPAESPA